MRSMLQLLGGVAVAGAVAAGSTAFTAGGLTDSVTAAQAFAGGTVSHAVVGATLTDLEFTQTAAVSAGGNPVSAAVLTFDANTPDGKVVTLTQTGGTAGNSATQFVCEAVGHTTTHISTCLVTQTDGTTPATYANITSVLINVS